MTTTEGAPTARRWTAAQAAYMTGRYGRQHPRCDGTQIVEPGDVGASTLTQHFVITRHGAVCRTFVCGTGPLMTEVTLLRRHHRGATFQGVVRREGPVFVARIPDGQTVTTERDYLDAEAALLRLRTGRRSHARVADWPRPIRLRLAAPAGAEIDPYFD